MNLLLQQVATLSDLCDEIELDLEGIEAPAALQQRLGIVLARAIQAIEPLAEELADVARKANRAKTLADLAQRRAAAPQQKEMSSMIGRSVKAQGKRREEEPEPELEPDEETYE